LLVFSHADCFLHQPGYGHPESPERLRAAWDALAAMNLPIIDAPFAPESALLNVHTPSHVKRLLALQGCTELVAIDGDTRISPGSINAALRAAGAGLAALDALMAGSDQTAFCAVRPPGHHANANEAMGFCLFNSAAIVAAQALELGLKRVSVVDFDVHHGNGTQDIFWHEPRVQYLSSHQAPLYPYSGAVAEHGDSGNIVNAPIPAGTGDAQFQQVWETQLLPKLAAFAPELIIISAGFDAHALDPLAGLNVHAGSFAWLTRKLCQQAGVSASGRVISLLEGGYSLSALRECITAHVLALGAPAPARFN
jgi:acetoin utilization deacetylase AcuC-like enzyme